MNKLLAILITVFLLTSCDQKENEIEKYRGNVYILTYPEGKSHRTEVISDPKRKEFDVGHISTNVKPVVSENEFISIKSPFVYCRYEAWGMFTDVKKTDHPCYIRVQKGILYISQVSRYANAEVHYSFSIYTNGTFIKSELSYFDSKDFVHTLDTGTWELAPK